MGLPAHGAGDAQQGTAHLAIRCLATAASSSQPPCRLTADAVRHDVIASADVAEFIHALVAVGGAVGADAVVAVGLRGAGGNCFQVR